MNIDDRLKKEQRRIQLLLALVASFLVLCVVMMLFANSYAAFKLREIEQRNKTAETQQQSNASSSEKKVIYVMKEMGGKIAVFKAGQQSPLMVMDVFVSHFPETDREALKKGIDIYSESELQQLIEDYTS